MLLWCMIATAAASLFLLRLLMLRREMGRMTEQLRRFNSGASGKKIDVSLFDEKLEQLAGQINAQSRLMDEAEAQNKRIRQEYRQAAVNMSHDIRTPLTSIRGYIQLLEGDFITPEEKREYIEIVKNRTGRLQSLLDDFFELAVIESPDDDLKTERLDMTGLLADILVSYYDLFNERGVSPIIAATNEKSFVYGDESAVRRVVENLLANAIKYADGAFEIRVERARETVSLHVCNEAKALAGSDVNLLFDRFYTADRARSAHTSGLGLSIAKSLMTKMGATLYAEMTGERLHMICRWRLASDDSDMT